MYYGIATFFLTACLSLLLGGYFFHFLNKKKISINSSSNNTINSEKLMLLVNLNIVLQLFFIFLAQFFLREANLFNLLTGSTNASDVEIALRNSPFGLNGILLIISIGGAILWYLCNLCKLHRSVHAKLLIAVTIFSFISQCKVQGLLIIIAMIITKQKNLVSVIKKFLILTIFFISIFFVTRLVRNQGGDFTLSYESFILMAFGLYMGAPFVNTSFILEHELWFFSSLEFFRYLIPQKLILNSYYPINLPDPSSPFGLFGHGLFLGSRGALYFYSFILGFFVSYIWVKSESSLAMKLFVPFLFVACTFSFLYDHFMNFMFFWVPFFGCIFLSDFLKDIDSNGAQK